MIPASITFLSEMPLNHAGKLNRDALIVPDEDARAVLDSVYREPQTALEAQLINIWETVLQVSPIGVDDKFLDLGGDSLSAARVFVEIEALLGGSLPPGVLYEHETISALSKVISVDPDLEDHQVLRLRKGSVGEAPLILISPFGGDPWLYAKLIEHLPDTWPIYGLHSWKHRDQKHMYADTRQVARDYLGAVRKMQADGALRFCGYSFGGVIALEMAQQLYQNEGICEPVALLDTIGPGLWPWHLYRPWTFTYRLAFGHFELTRWQHIMGGIRDLRQIFFVVFRWIEKSWVDLISRKKPKYFPIINNPLFRRYVPKVYPGKGLNVVTSQSKDHFRTETLAWKDYFESGYEEFHIESTHRNFLKEEHSETVAEKLRDLYSSN
jgi:thioesterase domain-containing protein/acyl carrier protein